MEDDDEGAFATEEVHAVINKVVNNCLASQPFSHLKVPQWVSTIVENCLKELAVMNDDTRGAQAAKFKYIVTCTLQQKTGAGMQTASCCYWDKATDGYVSVKWESDHMQALCTVYGVVV